MLALAFSNLATPTFETVNPEFNFQGDGKAYFTTGLHKLASQAVFLLLTEQGTVAGDSGMGLQVRSRLASISLTELNAVEQILSEITRDLSDQLIALTGLLPDDERLGAVQVYAFEVTGVDQLTVQLEITSVAGDTAVYNTTLITRNV